MPADDKVRCSSRSCPLPQLLLCMASDADGSTIRVCRNAEEAMAFYKEMWGEDQGGGIKSQIDHFEDEDNWSHGLTEYHCELYCSTFRVWRVDANELSVPSEKEPTLSLSGCRPRLFGSGGVQGTLGPLGVLIFEDPKLPDDVMEFRDGITGRVLGKIINVGKE